MKYIRSGRVDPYTAQPLPVLFDYHHSFIFSPKLNMKTTAVATIALAALGQVTQAHYIFQQLTANGAKGALCT